ncbi:hypothetical protein [Haloferula sp. BvORR071]|uniref:hypothetical protein n=1 Tax=Haloferula sp. BvORR071 TaxID=1396141 RepID=UPI002240FF5D|nr:hypothetical protein [Haloferula sp. BvORR071]
MPSYLGPEEQAFASLLHAVPEDDLAQSTLITSLVLSIWQFSGSAFSISAPSFLLVNGSDGEDEAFKALARLMGPMFNPAFPPKRTSEPHPEANGLSGHPDHARTTMRAALALRSKLRARNLDPVSLKRLLGDYPAYWQQYKAALFPAVEANHYDQAWDKDFGFVTGDDDHISLIVLSKESRAALLRDLVKHLDRLLSPKGFNNQLDPTTKRVALTGSFPMTEWNTDLVDATLALPKPVFHLPHFLGQQVVIENLRDLVPPIVASTRFYRHHPGMFFTDTTQQPVLDDFQVYEGLIRRISASLPGDREFLLRNFIRQLGTVTDHIAQAIGKGSRDSPMRQALHADLYRTTLRGIAYSLVALQYHAHGLGLGNNRALAADVLSFIRSKGSATRREVQRKAYTLDADSRDHLLQCLEDAGLVVTENKMVRPVPFEDFLKASPVRERFPHLSLLTAGLLVNPA